MARIANALDVTVEEIYIQAGIVPSHDRTGELRLKRLERAFRNLSPSRQDEVLAIVNALGALPDPNPAPHVVGDNNEGGNTENDLSPTGD